MVSMRNYVVVACRRLKRRVSSAIRCRCYTLDDDDDVSTVFYSACSEIDELEGVTQSNGVDRNEAVVPDCTDAELFNVVRRIITDVLLNPNHVDQASHSPIPDHETALGCFLMYYKKISRKYRRVNYDEYCKAITWTGRRDTWWVDCKSPNYEPQSSGGTGSLMTMSPVLSEENLSVEETLYVYRICVARGWNTEKVSEMLSNDIRWRLDNKVYHVWRNFSRHSEFDFTNYPHGYYGVDRDGHPVYYDRLGKLDVASVLSAHTLTEITEYYIYMYENLQRVIMPACSISCGRRIYRSTTVIDLSGLSLSHLSPRCKHLLQVILSMSQDHFPESMHKTIIINAPMMLKAFWGLLKSILSTETMEKIEVAKTTDQLATYIDKDQLPPFILNDDSSTDWCRTHAIGPWRDPNILSQVVMLGHI